MNIQSPNAQMSPVGLPNEVKLGNLDFSLPPDARSTSVKIQPSNIAQVQSPTLQTGALTATAGSGSTGVELSFPIQNLIFDIPAGASPSQFIDTRFSTLNFRLQIDVTTAASTAITNVALRSHANSFFDRQYTIAQNGNIVEDLTEYGLLNDTLINLQMNNAVRDGCALQYGFDPSSSANTSQGLPLPVLAGTSTGSETHSFSVPLVNSLIGVTADKFFNIGRTSKLQVVFQTAGILPITIDNAGGTTLTGSGVNFKVTLLDFSLQLEYIDIGLNALRMLDETLVSGVAYNHGISYRTASMSLPASSSGQQTLLAGIRASSVKSLFARFQETGVTNNKVSLNGKFDSKNPSINALNFNIGGVRYPQVPINPLVNPSQAFRELQMAIGAFNSTQFQSSIVPARYCVLSAGGTVSTATTTAGTQAYDYQNNTTSATAQSSFIFGENVEVCAKRGVMSGLNCTSAPIFLEANVSVANTNTHNVYVQGMIDVIYVHNVSTGDVQVRM
jgi:hypothetical protein